MIPLTIKEVPPGTVAPKSIPKGEIWIDVGGRGEWPVFDHHGGCGDSAAALVARDADRVREEAVSVVVVHQKPDLDALTGIWIVDRIQRNVLWPGDPGLDIIVDWVTEHDRGVAHSGDLQSDWAMLLAIWIAGGSVGTEGVFEILDRTLAYVRNGGPRDGAATVLPQEARILAGSIFCAFERDLQNAIVGRATVFNVSIERDESVPAIHAVDAGSFVFHWLSRHPNAMHSDGFVPDHIVGSGGVARFSRRIVASCRVRSGRWSLSSVRFGVAFGRVGAAEGRYGERSVHFGTPSRTQGNRALRMGSCRAVVRWSRPFPYHCRRSLFFG